MLLGIICIIIGFIIGLGAVTVIDIHGFLGRHSSYWTEATIRTHKVTKPMIWIGMTLVTVGAFLLYPNTSFFMLQLILIICLVCNGIFLSFFVSRKLILQEKEGRSKDLLPQSLRTGIGISFIISFLGWWGSVALFVYYLSTVVI